MQSLPKDIYSNVLCSKHSNVALYCSFELLHASKFFNLLAFACDSPHILTVIFL